MILGVMMSRSKGYTLIEVLIVIAIIGLLIQVMLPAIVAAREAARRAWCDDNLRQISLAAQHHASVHGHLPSGGWGYRWVGDPDRGYDKNQPGSWQYNLLPFLDYGHLRQFGRGMTDEEKRRALVRVVGTPIAVFSCPSRRRAVAMPYWSDGFANIERPKTSGRSDYAANMGSLPPTDQAGPASLEEGDDWTIGEDLGEEKEEEKFWTSTNHNGVVFQRSMIRPVYVRDGMSNTYLVGEKYLQIQHYESGLSWGDDQNLYTGHDKDNIRSTNLLHPPRADDSEPEMRMFHDHNRAYFWNFGSPHRGTVGMAMCDGSVQRINISIDPLVHADLGNRMDVAAVKLP